MQYHLHIDLVRLSHYLGNNNQGFTYPVKPVGLVVTTWYTVPASMLFRTLSELMTFYLQKVEIISQRSKQHAKCIWRVTLTCLGQECTINTNSKVYGYVSTVRCAGWQALRWTDAVASHWSLVSALGDKYLDNKFWHWIWQKWNDPKTFETRGPEWPYRCSEKKCDIPKHTPQKVGISECINFSQPPLLPNKLDNFGELAKIQIKSWPPWFFHLCVNPINS